MFRFVLVPKTLPECLHLKRYCYTRYSLSMTFTFYFDYYSADLPKRWDTVLCCILAIAIISRLKLYHNSSNVPIRAYQS